MLHKFPAAEEPPPLLPPTRIRPARRRSGHEPDRAAILHAMSPRERIADARGAAARKAADARDAAVERAAEARDAAVDRVADAKAAAGDFIERQKPRLRGVFHEWGFFASLVAGGALVLAAPNGEATLAAAIYAASLS